MSAGLVRTFTRLFIAPDGSDARAASTQSFPMKRPEGSCCLRQAIDTAGYGYVLGLKENQRELLREAQRLLLPRAATQGPEPKVVERDHGQWVRRSLWRTTACAGWLAWPHLRQAWLVRTEKCVRQTSPRANSVPAEIEDHYYITNVGWKRLQGSEIVGVVPGHWGIENHGFRTLDMDWQEEHARCTKGAATEVLGLLRLWAYNLVGMLKGRYLRAAHYRRLTLEGFVRWVETISARGKVRRRRYRVVPVG